jgi:superfamily I DNA/RNA helicase
VFVLNVVDGCIPSDLGTGTTAEIDEERRLLYVAMTRAKDSPTLSVPFRYYVMGQARNGDRHLHATRTTEVIDREVHKRRVDEPEIDDVGTRVAHPATELCGETRRTLPHISANADRP